MMDDRFSARSLTWLLDHVPLDPDAAEDDLFEQVYSELRTQAQQQRRHWAGTPSLQTTALAHEAYLKLVHQEHRSWTSRSHFFAVAARAMRHILIDRARRTTREKRGGDAPTLSLEELKMQLGRDIPLTADKAEAFVILDEALKRLEAEHPRAARGVECRFFGGMSIDETAEALGVSARTVSRDWTHARLWLYREMKRIRGSGGTDEETAPENHTS